MTLDYTKAGLTAETLSTQSQEEDEPQMNTDQMKNRCLSVFMCGSNIPFLLTLRTRRLCGESFLSVHIPGGIAIDLLAFEKCQQHFCLVDPVCRDFEQVFRQHDQIAGFARFQ